MALILKRASAYRPSGEWNDDDYDVLADGVVVGPIMKGRCGTEECPVRVGWSGSHAAAGAAINRE
jgi:hypothetical protein